MSLRRTLLYGFISIAAALGSSWGSSGAQAATYVYHVGVALSQGRHLTGTITTNCNDCTLNVSNIVAFRLILSGPTVRSRPGIRRPYIIASPPSSSLAPYTPGYISEAPPLPLVATPTAISFDGQNIWDGSISFSQPGENGFLMFLVQNYVAMIRWYDLPPTTGTTSTFTTVMGIPANGFSYQIASR